MLAIDARWRHQQRRNRSGSRRTTHPAGLRRHEGAGALGSYSASLIEFTTSCTCEVEAPLPSTLVSWHNNCPTAPDASTSTDAAGTSTLAANASMVMGPRLIASTWHCGSEGATATSVEKSSVTTSVPRTPPV